MNEEPVKAETNRRPDGTFGPNNTANPAGRPKGQSLKEFWKQRLSLMSEEEKKEFTKQVTKEVIWKMAEGQPRQPLVGEDSEGNPVPLFNYVRNNLGDAQNQESPKTD